MRAAITAFVPSQQEAIASLLAEGLIEFLDATQEYQLTERGAEMVARECGWARGEDTDGDECFMHTGSYNTFSYAQTWFELVTDQRLAVFTGMRGMN